MELVEHDSEVVKERKESGAEGCVQICWVFPQQSWSGA